MNAIKVMFDTNVFNHILDCEIQLENIPAEWEVYGTHIQRDEINQTPENYKDRREALLNIFHAWLDVLLPTESAVWDVSSWDDCKWGDEEDNLYKEILDDLNKRRERSNNIQDALIAETAIKNALVLVTNDQSLKAVAQKCGAEVKDIRVSKGSKV